MKQVRCLVPAAAAALLSVMGACGDSQSSSQPEADASADSSKGGQGQEASAGSGGGSQGGASGATGAAGTAGAAAGATGGSGIGGAAGWYGTGGAGGSAGGFSYQCDKFSNVTADAACTLYASGDCHVFMDCLTGNPRFSSTADCQASMKAMCIEQLSAPGSGDKPALYAALGEARGALTCEQYFDDWYAQPQIVGDPAACRGPGGLADGTQCYLDAQCESGRCVFVGEVCGTCGGGEGQACSGKTSLDCSPHHGCDLKTLKCVAQATQGSACTGYFDCEEGLYCDDTDHCEARRPAGAPCIMEAQCVRGLICGDNQQCKKPSMSGEGVACTKEFLSCNYFQGFTCEGGICVASEALNPGDTCGLFHLDGSTVFKTRCVGGSSCAFPEGQTTGTCVLNAQDGQPCESLHGASCVILAKCVNNVCVVPTATVCPAN